MCRSLATEREVLLGRENSMSQGMERALHIQDGTKKHGRVKGKGCGGRTGGGRRRGRNMGRALLLKGLVIPSLNYTHGIVFIFQ